MSANVISSSASGSSSSLLRDAVFNRVTINNLLTELDILKKKTAKKNPSNMFLLPEIPFSNTYIPETDNKDRLDIYFTNINEEYWKFSELNENLEKIINKSKQKSYCIFNNNSSNEYLFSFKKIYITDTRYILEGITDIENINDWLENNNLNSINLKYISNRS